MRAGLTDCIELILSAMNMLEGDTDVFNTELLKQEDEVADDHEFQSIGNTGSAPMGSIKEKNKQEENGEESNNSEFDKEDYVNADQY